MPDFSFGRLSFRALNKDNLPLFLAWFQDPEVIQNLGAPMAPYNLAEETAWYEAEQKKPIDERAMSIWLVDNEKGTEKLIGNCGFHAIDRKNRSGEIGLLIGDKTEWNKGYGREAVQFLIWHGFYNLNLHRVWLRVHSPNKRGIKAYENAGMKLDGILREAHFQEGQYVDVHIMSILRSEWDDPKEKEVLV